MATSLRPVPLYIILRSMRPGLERASLLNPPSELCFCLFLHPRVAFPLFPFIFQVLDIRLFVLVVLLLPVLPFDLSTRCFDNASFQFRVQCAWPSYQATWHVTLKWLCCTSLASLHGKHRGNQRAFGPSLPESFYTHIPTTFHTPALHLK